MKPEKEEAARDLFGQTSINISTPGQKHLGAVLGVSEKVDDCVCQVVKLEDFAATQPQACYAAYTFGLKHKWTYYLRTLSDIQELLEPLEHTISDALCHQLRAMHAQRVSENCWHYQSGRGDWDLKTQLSELDSNTQCLCR